MLAHRVSQAVWIFYDHILKFKEIKQNDKIFLYAAEEKESAEENCY